MARGGQLLALVAASLLLGAHQLPVVAQQVRQARPAAPRSCKTCKNAPLKRCALCQCSPIAQVGPNDLTNARSGAASKRCCNHRPAAAAAAACSAPARPCMPPLAPTPRRPGPSHLIVHRISCAWRPRRTSAPRRRCPAAPGPTFTAPAPSPTSTCGGGGPTTCWMVRRCPCHSPECFPCAAESTAAAGAHATGSAECRGPSAPQPPTEPQPGAARAQAPAPGRRPPAPIPHAAPLAAAPCPQASAPRPTWPRWACVSRCGPKTRAPRPWQTSCRPSPPRRWPGYCARAAPTRRRWRGSRP